MEQAMAPHSSTLAWKIPLTEETGRLQSVGSLRVGHDWATSLSLFTFMHWRRKWQPTPVFLPGESQGRGSRVGCRLWGHPESDTTEATWQHHEDNTASKHYSYLIAEETEAQNVWATFRRSHSWLSRVAYLASEAVAMEREQRMFQGSSQHQKATVPHNWWAANTPKCGATWWGKSSCFTKFLNHLHHHLKHPSCGSSSFGHPPGWGVLVRQSNHQRKLPWRALLMTKRTLVNISHFLLLPEDLSTSSSLLRFSKDECHLEINQHSKHALIRQ